MYIVQNNRLNCAEQRVGFWPPGEDLNFRSLGDTVQDLHRVEGCRAPGHSKLQGRGGLSFTKERRIVLTRLEKNSESKRKQHCGLRRGNKNKTSQEKKENANRKEVTRPQNLVLCTESTWAPAIVPGPVEWQG